MKKIVICCDGTGNEYGTQNSNVVKLYQCLDGSNGSQISYYHPGVGTMGDMRALSTAGKVWTKFRGLAFGYGFSQNIADAYQFLMQTFEDGDAVYIFGFSRGAYIARALCGMLEMFGLLCPGNDGLIPYAMRLFKRRDGLRVRLGIRQNKYYLARGFRSTFGRDCKPHFLGVWDTVSSVGWILDPLGSKAASLPYTFELRDVSTIRHAVSLDERRAFFRSNLVREAPPPRLKEVWFAGVHSDVGGSYAEAESGLSKITLSWMFREAAEFGLQLDSATVKIVLGEFKHARPLPSAKKHNSLTVWWWLGEFWPKFTKRRISPPGVSPEKYRGWPRLNLFRRRHVPDGACIHESVIKRMQIFPDYRPSNLPTQRTIEPDLESVPLELQLESGASASFTIFASLKWNNTTLQVRTGQTYELAATGTWYDARQKSGPEGYTSKKWLMRLFSSRRRRPKDDWFALIGAIGQEKETTFLIGTSHPWEVKADGTLNCFANDVPGFYFNNSGTVMLTVTRTR
jgi:uncharacterized protein (DUF2235 family)